MPVQVKRLIIVFVVIIGLMLTIRYFLKPDSWGELGPYRSKAIKEIADQTPKYINKEDCAMCHDSIANLLADGEHKSINCQTCHGPGYKHIEEPDTSNIEKPHGREFCVRCHALNPARPSDIIKQVDAIEHNKGEICISCHNPHKPWL